MIIKEKNIILNLDEAEQINNSDNTLYEDMQEMLYKHTKKLGDEIENYDKIICPKEYKILEESINEMLAIQKGEIL